MLTGITDANLLLQNVTFLNGVNAFIWLADTYRKQAIHPLIIWGLSVPPPRLLSYRYFEIRALFFIGKSSAVVIYQWSSGYQRFLKQSLH